MCPDRADRGSASVWLLGLSTLISLVMVVGVVLGTAVIARHRVETAADLAALAGAGTIAAGRSDGCRRAALIAVRNGARLVSCAISGDDVEVTVSRPVGLGRLGFRTASAQARAGPVVRP